MFIFSILHLICSNLWVGLRYLSLLVSIFILYYIIFLWCTYQSSSSLFYIFDILKFGNLYLLFGTFLATFMSVLIRREFLEFNEQILVYFYIVILLCSLLIYVKLHFLEMLYGVLYVIICMFIPFSLLYTLILSSTTFVGLLVLLNSLILSLILVRYGGYLINIVIDLVKVYLYRLFISTLYYISILRCTYKSSGSFLFDLFKLVDLYVYLGFGLFVSFLQTYVFVVLLCSYHNDIHLYFDEY